MKQVLIKQNVGIDISKDDFKVAFNALNESYEIITLGAKTFTNSKAGFKSLLQWVESKAIKGINLTFTMEATGVYYENLAYYLIEREYIVFVILPNQSKKYAESLGTKSKTDKIDASILAKMGIERKLRTWQPNPKYVLLKQLTRERMAIIQERTNAKNQLHAYKHQGIVSLTSIARSENRIAILNEQVNEIEKEIAKIVNQDKELADRLDNIQSIPGVGLITAITIVAEANGFETINSIKQLTSYAGLDVQIAESGLWKGKSRISKKGNSHIRKALYFPSLTKIKHDGPTKLHYERLKNKKAKPMIAAVAVQRKLLGLIYTLWKKNEKFCSNFNCAA
jgi:transposase